MQKIKKELRGGIGDFNLLIKDWVINNRPDLLDSLNNSILLEKEMIEISLMRTVFRL